MSTAHTAALGDEDSARPIRTVAGTGDAAFGGDKGPAAAAQLNGPYGIAVDSTGTLCFSDHHNHRVRKITTDGRIRTVAGTGEPGFSGDDGPAVSARLNCPREVAVDSAGAVYIADAGNHRIRKIATDGTIRTFAGTGTGGFSGDGGPAVDAELKYPHGVAVDSTGAVYIADCDNHRVRKVTADQQIHTVVGADSGGFGGDGGLAVSARLNKPFGVAVDCVGTLYIADYGNHRIRKVAAPRMAGLPESGTVVCCSSSTSPVTDAPTSSASAARVCTWRETSSVVSGPDSCRPQLRGEQVPFGRVLSHGGAVGRHHGMEGKRAWAS